MKKAILVVGTGSIGERHLRCFQATERCGVSACEPNDELRTRIVQRYQCPAYASVADALAGAVWDAVVICTPAHTHIGIAAQFLDAGAHIFIEKPLSISLDGIDELIRQAAHRQAVVRVAYVHRSILVLQALKQALREPGFENIRHGVVASGQNFPLARPAYASSYYTRRETGGGCIQDALTHQFNTVEWLLGPIDRVYCDASHEVLAEVKVEDTVNMTTRLREGAAVSFSMNQFQAPSELTFTLHGPAGSLRAELHRNRLGRQRQGEGGWSFTDFPAEERDAMFIRQAHAFLDALQGRPDPLATLEDALQTLKVNLAALRSADRRQETFV